MDQRITVKIGEREYVLKAPTPEHEELFRLAAQAVDKRLKSYLASYPDKTPADLLSFVALNECVSRIQAQRKMDASLKEVDSLKTDIESYLKSIDKK
ncbi:MAG: cell division protein ZapA [Bacteroidales bacterium]|nr:cell division protein ZapA [Bacteroidales bacterium]